MSFLADIFIQNKIDFAICSDWFNLLLLYFYSIEQISIIVCRCSPCCLVDFQQLLIFVFLDAKIYISYFSYYYICFERLVC